MSFNAQVLYLNQNKRKQEVKFDHEKLDECMCYIVKFNRQIHAHIWHLLVLSEPGIQFKCFSMRSFNWVRQYWTTTIFFFFPLSSNWNFDLQHSWNCNFLLLFFILLPYKILFFFLLLLLLLFLCHNIDILIISTRSYRNQKTVKGDHQHRSSSS